MSVLRIFLVTVFASVSGAMLGALMSGIHPFGGLTMMPLTLVASLCLLLPSYAWSRRVQGMTRTRSYLVVVAAGALGGFVALFLVFGIQGRLNDNFVGEMVRLLSIGTAFGGATGICWVVAHHLLRSTSRLGKSR